MWTSTTASPAGAADVALSSSSSAASSLLSFATRFAEPHDQPRTHAGSETDYAEHIVLDASSDDNDGGSDDRLRPEVVVDASAPDSPARVEGGAGIRRRRDPRENRDDEVSAYASGAAGPRRPRAFEDMYDMTTVREGAPAVTLPRRQPSALDSAAVESPGSPNSYFSRRKASSRFADTWLGRLTGAAQHPLLLRVGSTCMSMHNLAAAADMRDSMAGPVRRLGSLFRVGSSTVSFGNLAALNEDDGAAWGGQAGKPAPDAIPAPTAAAATSAVTGASRATS